MTDFNTSNTEINTAADAVATPVVAKPAPTKEERIAAVKAQIKKLEDKLFNIENDIPTGRVVRVVELPTAGSEVLFSYGRKTATTDPVLKAGVVVAVKPEGQAANGKKTPAQVKVQCGEGFDAEFFVIYPAQIVPAGTTNEQLAAESDEDDAA